MFESIAFGISFVSTLILIPQLAFRKMTCAIHSHLVKDNILPADMARASEINYRLRRISRLDSGWGARHWLFSIDVRHRGAVYPMTSAIDGRCQHRDAVDWSKHS